MNKKLENKKPATLESVASSVELLAEGIDSLAKKFDYVNKRFDEFDAKLDGLAESVQGSLEGLENRLNAKIDYKFDTLSRRMDAMSDEKVSYKIFYRQNKVFDERLSVLEKTG